ncbi:transcriptional regulator, partial [Clostridioides difficile]
MEKECQQRMQEITSKFKECRKAISAMGDETRQLILIALLESDFNGIRVGEITK